MQLVAGLTKLHSHASMVPAAMERPSDSPRPGESPVRVTRIGQVFRRYFLTGLAALFPGFVTVWLLVQIFRFADGLLGSTFNLKIPGLGLVLTVLIVLIVGAFSTHFLGRVVFPAMELWFARLPLVNKIYPTVKQLSRSIFSEDEEHATFRRVVMVEYPRAGAYSLAFVTNEGPSEAWRGPKTLLTLLIPTPPNPFTGPIIFVPKEDAIPLQLSVEDAVKLVISGGVVAPPLIASQHP